MARARLELRSAGAGEAWQSDGDGGVCSMGAGDGTIAGNGGSV